eukprot:748309-Hanusia_phi.AAC.3
MEFAYEPEHFERLFKVLRIFSTHPLLSLSCALAPLPHYLLLELLMALPVLCSWHTKTFVPASPAFSKCSGGLKRKLTASHKTSATP